MGAQKIHTMKLWDAAALTQNTNTSSVLIDLRQIADDYVFSLHSIIAGAGTVKFEYLLCSDKAGTAIEPAGATDIATGATGSQFVAFAPETAPFMKIKATEENVGAITSMTVWLNIR